MFPLALGWETTLASRAPLRSGGTDVAGSGAAGRETHSQVFALPVSQSLCCTWPFPSRVHTALYPLRADTHDESSTQLSAYLEACERRARSLLVIRETPSRARGGEWNSSGLGFSPFRDLAASTGKCVHPRERGRDRKWEVWRRGRRLWLRPLTPRLGFETAPCSEVFCQRPARLKLELGDSALGRPAAVRRCCHLPSCQPVSRPW